MELRHCKNVLTPAETVTFNPASTLMLDVPVKYRKAKVSLIQSFQSVTFATYKCPGYKKQNSQCNGVVYAWQGINFDGEVGDVEKIDNKDLDIWQSFITNVSDTRKKGSSAVSGSQRVYPYRFMEQIPVYR